jgi:hypothetical protein
MVSHGASIRLPSYTRFRKPPCDPEQRLSLSSFPACRDPYSSCSQGALARFYPWDIGLPQVNMGRRLASLRHSYFGRRTILELQSFLYVPAHRFVRLTGSSGRAYHGWLPAPCSDYANQEIRIGRVHETLCFCHGQITSSGSVNPCEWFDTPPRLIGMNFAFSPCAIERRFQDR